MNEEELTRFIRTISAERISPFQNIARDINKKRANEISIILYMRNISISKELYELLHLFEVTFRNFIDYSMSNLYGEDWFDTFDFRDRESVKINEAVNRIRKKSSLTKILKGKVISELSLNFWIILFERENETKFLFKIIKGLFPYMKKSDRKVKDIRKSLNRIVRIRNRVAHHEPLILNIELLVEAFNDLKLLILGMEPLIIEKGNNVDICISNIEKDINSLLNLFSKR